MNDSLEGKSECNVSTDSQHANRTQSIRDLDDLSSKGKEKATPRNQTEDVARKDTPTSTQTQLIKELLLLELLREFRDKNVHGNLHFSPQYGAGPFGQPHTNPTSDTSLHLLLAYKIPSAHVTEVHHYHHYYHNAPNAFPSTIINNIKNINSGNMNNTNMDNTNISNDPSSSESGDDEGEPYFLNGWLPVDIDFTRNDDKHDRQRDARGEECECALRKAIYDIRIGSFFASS